MSNWTGLVPLVLILLVFWLLIIRPQRRRQLRLSQTQSSLVIGSEVMLTSGIFGRVVSLEDETIHLEVAAGTTVKVARQAVVRVVEPHPAELTDQPVQPLTDDPAQAPTVAPADEPTDLRSAHPDDEETR